MAGDKEEFPPLLGPGFYDLGIDGVRRLCVERFPDSVTRPSIMEKLTKVVELIQSNGMRGQVWINGSFLTNKLNPDDSDIVLVVMAEEYLKFNQEQRAFWAWFRDTDLKPSMRCDNYAFIREGSAHGEWNYAYWLRQFGFSRADEMKGLAVIKIPFVVMP